MLQFSETVEIALDAISVSSSMSCSQEVNAQTQVCGHGSVSWSVNLALITDLVGHPVGQGLVHFLLDNPAPEPDPIPQEPAPQPQAVTPAPVPAPVQPEPVAPPAEPQPTGPAIVVDPSPEPIPVTESASISETVTQSEGVTESESVDVEPVSESAGIEVPVADSAGPWEEFASIEAAIVQEFAVQSDPQLPAQSTLVPGIKVGEETVSEVQPAATSEESEPEIQDLVSGPQVDLEQDQSWPWLEIAIASLLLGLIAFGAYRTIGK
jgi:hypothetical protein